MRNVHRIIEKPKENKTALIFSHDHIPESKREVYNGTKKGV